jgi:hypothetical protein
MDWENLRTGTVIGDANMSDPLPSGLKPGWECALHRYPLSGHVWLFMRPVGEKSWRPKREATEADIEAFRHRGLIRPQFFEPLGAAIRSIQKWQMSRSSSSAPPPFSIRRWHKAGRRPKKPLIAPGGFQRLCLFS